MIYNRLSCVSLLLGNYKLVLLPTINYFHTLVNVVQCDRTKNDSNYLLPIICTILFVNFVKCLSFCTVRNTHDIKGTHTIFRSFNFYSHV